MSEKRYFGFTDFSNWVSTQVTNLSNLLDTKLTQTDERLEEFNTTISTKADQNALESTNLVVSTKADISSVHNKTEAQSLFLGVGARAVDSSLLDGKTKAQIILEALVAANLDSKMDASFGANFATAAQGLKADSAVQPSVMQSSLNTKLNITSYTASDVLAKLLTVDGANSGLDADKLDGKELALIESEYKAFVNLAIANLVDSSPAALNTLKELAAALGNDPNFATTVATQIGSKADSTDPRFSDSREWSAITITQAEAEAGTATTRRAWTALRVRQAIQAWWVGSADKTKLDGIAAGAQVNVATNLSYTAAASSGQVASSTGTNVTLPVATTVAAGLLSSADKTKLDGVAAGAQVNVATNLGYAAAANAGTVSSSTGTNVTLPAATTTAAGLLTATDKTKLDGVAAGATANSSNAVLLARSNHTGTQAISTVSGLQEALDSKFSTSGGTTTGNITAPSFYASNWFRSTGATGWFNETYGGGIHMSDATWVRVYGSKSFYVTGNIAATGDISGYYSDERLKENFSVIDDALASLRQIEGVRYNANALAASFGYDTTKVEVGFRAQQVQRVMPEVVELAPFDYGDEPGVSKSGENYLTMKYSRMTPLIVNAVKELDDKVEINRRDLDNLMAMVADINQVLSIKK